MRELLFKVNGQKIEKHPSCDFKNIVKGSKGHLRAVFKFDGSWSSVQKVAAFYSHSGSEAAVVLENNSCMVPDEVLDGLRFGVCVGGINKQTQFMTNKVWVYQK